MTTTATIVKALDKHATELRQIMKAHDGFLLSTEQANQRLTEDMDFDKEREKMRKLLEVRRKQISRRRSSFSSFFCQSV